MFWSFLAFIFVVNVGDETEKKVEFKDIFLREIFGDFLLGNMWGLEKEGFGDRVGRSSEVKVISKIEFGNLKMKVSKNMNVRWIVIEL